MDVHALLTTLAVVLGVAGITTVATRLLGQSSVLGYLLAGLIVGPNVASGLDANREIVTTLSELGVILLMFSIGLELSVRKVTRLASTAGPAALIEMGLMGVLGVVTAAVLGLSSLDGAFMGAMLAISSTMVIAKTFADLRVRGHAVDVVFGILVFEDIVAIVLLTVLTGLAAGLTPSPGSLALTFLKLAAFLLGAVAVGLPVIPRFIRLVQRQGSAETTTVASIGVCFVLASIASLAGFSVALGAILAGVLCAESGHGEELERLVAPLRDVFSAIFFVSVGMLIDPLAVTDLWLPILVVFGVVLVGKFVAVTVGATLAGESVGAALRAGASLAQIGEFSFIIAGLGVSSGAASPKLLPVAVVVSALTAFTTPLLVARSERMAVALEGRLPDVLRTALALYHAWVARLRGRSLGAARAPGRQHVRRLVLEVVGVILLAAVAGVVADPLSSYLRRYTGTPAWALRGVLGVLVMGFSVPFLIGIVRNARALAFIFATALSGRALALGAVPPPLLTPLERVLRAVLMVVIVAVVTMPLMAVVLPILPGGSTLALGFAALAVLASLARPLRLAVSEARTGAQIVLEAFQRQLQAGDAEVPALEGGPVAAPEREASVLDSLDPVLVLLIEPGWACVGLPLARTGAEDAVSVTVLAVLRADGVSVAPGGGAALEPGDRLIASGTPDGLAGLKAALTTGATPE